MAAMGAACEESFGAVAMEKRVVRVPGTAEKEDGVVGVVADARHELGLGGRPRPVDDGLRLGVLDQVHRCITSDRSGMVISDL